MITDYCCAVQEKAFEDAGSLLNTLTWYLSQNSNTMKNGLNPETHTIAQEAEPLEIGLDVSGYAADGAM